MFCKTLIESKAEDGWVLLDCFSDPGISGSKLNRPGLKALLRGIRMKKYDAVVVYRRDRLTRSFKHQILLEQEFVKYGVALISYSEPHTSNRAADMFAKNVLSLTAELEVETTKERIQDNVRSRVMRGQWVGGHASYGYKYDKATKTLVPVPEEAAIIKRIFAEAAAGRRTIEITKDLKAEGFRTRPYRTVSNNAATPIRSERAAAFTSYQVRLFIQNPVYRGYVRCANLELRTSDKAASLPKMVEYPGQHEPLVSDALWLDANKSLKAPAKFGIRLSERDKHGYILKGLLVCGHCLCQLTTTYANKRRPDGKFYRYYRCVRSNKEGVSCGCNVKPVQADALESSVLTFLSRVVQQPELIKETLAMFSNTRSESRIEAEKRLEAIEYEMAELNAKLSVLLERSISLADAFADYAREQGQEMATRRLKLDQERTVLINSIQTLRAASPDANEITKAIDSFDKLVRVLPIEKQKEVLKLVCERIEIGRPQSAAYLRAVQSGQNPRIFRVRVFLCVNNMLELGNELNVLQSGRRPQANFNLGYTVEFPLTRFRIPFVFLNGDGVAAYEVNKDQPLSAEADIEFVNVIQKAELWAPMLADEPDETGTSLAKKLNVSGATVSLHLKVVRKLDPQIKLYLRNCNEPKVHTWFSLRQLLELAEYDLAAQHDRFREGVEESLKAKRPTTLATKPAKQINA